MKHRGIIVVKLGSAVLTNDLGDVDQDFMQDICQQLLCLQSRGWASVLVSSGAKLSGQSVIRRHAIGMQAFPDSRRTLSAIGQAHLITNYANCFERSAGSLVPAQILLTRQTLADRERYLVIRDTLTDMLSNNVVPIINNNDTTVSTHINFVDNDQMAAYLAGMLSASLVVLVGDAGGVYDRNPRIHCQASRIKVLSRNLALWPTLEIDDTGSSFGGMTHKMTALQLLSLLGIPARVAPKGEKDLVIRSVLDQDDDFGTRMDAERRPSINHFKRWLQTGAFPRGIIVLSDVGAEKISRQWVDRKSISILSVGVIGHYGPFERGDPVTVRDANHDLVGIGRTRVGAKDFRELASQKQSYVVIHANDFVPASQTRFLDLNDRQFVIASVNRMRSEGFYVQSNRAGRGEGNGGLIRIGNRYDRQSDYGDCYKGHDARQIWFEALQASSKLGISPDDWILFSKLL